jgi:plastocyanin
VPTRPATIPAGRRGPGPAGAAFAVAALGAVGLVACSSSSSTNAAGTTTTTRASTTSTTTSASSTTAGSSTSAAPAPPANGVNIVDYAFGPKTLTVKAGTTVTWKNYDQFAHEVTSASGDPGPAFDLGQQGQGATVSHTFTAPGTYHYYCNIHNYMTGTIVVTP